MGEARCELYFLEHQVTCRHVETWTRKAWRAKAKERELGRTKNITLQGGRRGRCRRDRGGLPHSLESSTSSAATEHHAHVHAMPCHHVITHHACCSTTPRPCSRQSRHVMPHVITQGAILEHAGQRQDVRAERTLPPACSSFADKDLLLLLDGPRRHAGQRQDVRAERTLPPACPSAEAKELVLLLGAMTAESDSGCGLTSPHEARAAAAPHVAPRRERERESAVGGARARAGGRQ